MWRAIAVLHCADRACSAILSPSAVTLGISLAAYNALQLLQRRDGTVPVRERAIQCAMDFVLQITLISAVATLVCWKPQPNEPVVNDPIPGDHAGPIYRTRTEPRSWLTIIPFASRDREDYRRGLSDASELAFMHLGGPLSSRISSSLNYSGTDISLSSTGEHFNGSLAFEVARCLAIARGNPSCSTFIET